MEWVNGRAMQKVSPRRKHGLAQMRFATALDRWATRRRLGRVATEWDYRIQPPGEVRRPLVPDVAFLSFAKVPEADDKAADIPRVAPDAVVEVLSPGDRAKDVNEKIRVYLASGTSVIFLVDTKRQEVIARDPETSMTFKRADTVRHESLPGFAMPAGELFSESRPKEDSRKK